MGITIIRPGTRLITTTPGVQIDQVGTAVASFTGVLDGVNNVAAAYGLRKLRSAYAGAAVRIRRSSDNAEQDIGFASDGEFDTSAFSSFVSGGTGFVRTWYDQSSNKDAGNSDTTRQPSIVLSDVNAKPSVSFDGSDGLLATNTITAAVNHTLIIVARSSGGSLFSGTQATHFDLNHNYVQYAAVTIAHTAFASAWSIGSYIRSSGNSKNYKNGATDGTSSSALVNINGITAVPYIGWRKLDSGNFFTGKITELIFATDALSAVNHNTIGSNMATRYGLSWTNVT